ncbi:MAG: GNAT family N-acetyltransferase [Clostridiales bacterium]|nr:GNAT family N-acetyltransferase [Clostridiales bacterium]
MTIRPAEKRDIPKIMDLLDQVHDLHFKGRPDIFVDGITKYSPEEVEKIMSEDNSPIYVAVDKKDNVLGYAFCIIKGNEGGISMTDIKTMYLDDLCVDKEHRKQGIGKKLFEYVCLKAKELGCYHVTLNLWTLNEDAQKFYESCGMSPMKVIMEKIVD